MNCKNQCPRCKHIYQDPPHKWDLCECEEALDKQLKKERGYGMSI